MDDNLKLKKLLEYVKLKVPFYADILSNRETVIEEFNSLPVMTKKEMKKNIIDFVSTDILCQELNNALSTEKIFSREYEYKLNGIKVIGEYTSGTSGSPFLSLKTINERMLLGKYLWKMRNNFAPINPQLFFDLVHNNGKRNYSFPFEKNENENIALIEELKYLNDSSFAWWHIHARKIYKYINIIRKTGIVPENLEVIENTGSYISEQEKLDFEDFFRCKIADNYGCREVWTIAFSNTDGLLQVDTETVLFELVDDTGEIIRESNIVGEIVVTSYFQKIMPFIRYKVGDRGCYLNSSNKIIKIIPDRAIIAGTNYYGSYYFKSVVLLLSTKFQIFNFEEVSIVQIDYEEFNVNIKGYLGEKREIECAFCKASQYIFKHNQYCYNFQYNNSYESKSLFSVGFNKAEKRRKYT